MQKRAVLLSKYKNNVKRKSWGGESNFLCMKRRKERKKDNAVLMVPGKKRECKHDGEITFKMQ